MFSAITIDGKNLVVSAYTVKDGKAQKADSFAIENAEEEFLLGDINLDGKITASDARLALRYSVKLDTLTNEQKVAANVNRDKTINAADARTILRASVDLEKIFPEYVYYGKLDLENITL